MFVNFIVFSLHVVFWFLHVVIFIRSEVSRDICHDRLTFSYIFDMWTSLCFLFAHLCEIWGHTIDLLMASILYMNLSPVSSIFRKDTNEII